MRARDRGVTGLRHRAASGSATGVVEILDSGAVGGSDDEGMPSPIEGRPRVREAVMPLEVWAAMPYEVHDTRGVRGWGRDHGPGMSARARSEIDRYVAVDNVIAAMHERIDQPFSLDEMARIAYLSPYYFNRVFRQVTGIPPRRFHMALRIAAAKRLLLTTDLSVTEVCWEIGYQSLGTFSTHFHELVGVSPRTLRRLATEPWLVPTGIGAGPARTAEAATATAVTGRIHGVDGHRSVFVGLFHHACPQGMPVACSAVSRSRRYALRTTVAGCYHVAAVAFEAAGDVHGGLMPDDDAVDVGLGRTPVQLGARRVMTRDVRLHPKRSTDPPILLALPAGEPVTEALIA
jgi:AraC-like DNA-binding protein